MSVPFRPDGPWGDRLGDYGTPNDNGFVDPALPDKPVSQIGIPEVVDWDQVLPDYTHCVTCGVVLDGPSTTWCVSCCAARGSW